LLDNIFTDPLQWQELAVFNFKPDQIHRLSVTRDRETALVRGPNNQWTVAQENVPPNQANIQSLLNTLSTLRAVRWVGANPPPHAFDKPQLVITFTTSPDDKAVHKLTVGAADPQGMCFAKVDEREGVFIISTPDFNGLRLSLVQPPAPPTVSPVASGNPASPTPVSAPK